MFVLKNEYGNITKKVETEREKDFLKSLGYSLVEKSTEVNLDKMKVSELEIFASKNGIDLSKCENRTEKIRKIKSTISE